MNFARALSIPKLKHAATAASVTILSKPALAAFNRTWTFTSSGCYVSSFFSLSNALSRRNFATLQPAISPSLTLLVPVPLSLGLSLSTPTVSLASASASASSIPTLSSVLHDTTSAFTSLHNLSLLNSYSQLQLQRHRQGFSSLLAEKSSLLNSLRTFSASTRESAKQNKASPGVENLHSAAENLHSTLSNTSDAGPQMHSDATTLAAAAAAASSSTSVGGVSSGVGSSTNFSAASGGVHSTATSSISHVRELFLSALSEENRNQNIRRVLVAVVLTATLYFGLQLYGDLLKKNVVQQTAIVAQEALTAEQLQKQVKALSAELVNSILSDEKILNQSAIFVQLLLAKPSTQQAANDLLIAAFHSSEVQKQLYSLVEKQVELLLSDPKVRASVLELVYAVINDDGTKEHLQRSMIDVLQREDLRHSMSESASAALERLFDDEHVHRMAVVWLMALLNDEKVQMKASDALWSTVKFSFTPRGWLDKKQQNQQSQQRDSRGSTQQTEQQHEQTTKKHPPPLQQPTANRVTNSADSSVSVQRLSMDSHQSKADISIGRSISDSAVQPLSADAQREMRESNHVGTRAHHAAPIATHATSGGHRQTFHSPETVGLKVAEHTLDRHNEDVEGVAASSSTELSSPAPPANNASAPHSHEPASPASEQPAMLTDAPMDLPVSASFVSSAAQVMRSPTPARDATDPASFADTVRSISEYGAAPVTDSARSSDGHVPTANATADNRPAAFDSFWLTGV